MAMASGVVGEDRKASAEAIALGSLIRDLRVAHGWSQGSARRGASAPFRNQSAVAGRFGGCAAAR